MTQCDSSRHHQIPSPLWLFFKTVSASAPPPSTSGRRVSGTLSPGNYVQDQKLVCTCYESLSHWAKQQLVLFFRRFKYLEVTGVPWPGTSRYSSAATSPSEYAASEVTFFYFPLCQIGNTLYPLCSAKEQVLISLYCCYLDFCKCCKNIYLSRSMLSTSFCCWDAFIHAFNCDVFTFGNVLTICHFCPHDKGK